MKYSLTFISILAGVAFAQDAALLTSLGFPQCSVKCIQEGNKAAQDQVGCGLTDVACQCGKGYTILQTAITNCVLKTTPCSDTDQNKIQPAGDALCAQFAGVASSSGTSSSGGHAGMSMSTSGSTAPKTTNAPQASNFVSTSGARTSSKAATGGGAAAATTSSKAIAAPDRTMAAGLLGLAGAAAALAL